MKKFNSQICTSREQSERLLALGLKKETADCSWMAITKDTKGKEIPPKQQRWFVRIGTDESAQVCGFERASFIPAWSLHRILELLPNEIKIQEESAYLVFGKQCVGYVFYYEGYDEFSFYVNIDREDMWESIIRCIGWLIKVGYFNKEYLV